MNIQRFFMVYLLCMITMLSTSVCAVETSIWEVQMANDFRKGEPTDVSIRSDGQVILSSPLELLYETEELFVWCLAQDSKENLYAGTGNWEQGTRVWRTSDGTHWTPASEFGFGTAYADENRAIPDMVEFDGDLYAGAGWGGSPGQLWRSPDGTTWTQVVGDETGEPPHCCEVDGHQRRDRPGDPVRDLGG